MSEILVLHICFSILVSRQPSCLHSIEGEGEVLGERPDEQEMCEEDLQLATGMKADIMEIPGYTVLS